MEDNVDVVVSEDILAVKAERLINIATKEDYYAQRTYEMSQVQDALAGYYATSQTEQVEVSVEGDGRSDEEVDGQDQSEQPERSQRTTRNSTLREKAAKVTKARG